MQSKTAEHINPFADYRTVRQSGWSVIVHKRFADGGLIDRIISEDSGSAGMQKVRSSDTARVYRCTADTADGNVGVYVKEYLPRTALDRLKDLARQSRAMRSFKAGLMLQESGLHTPQIAALLVKRSACGVCRRSILVTEEMPDAQALYRVFEEVVEPGETAALRRRRDMIGRLGQTIGQMHAMHICHGDLRSGNLFVSGDGAQSEFYFIDNERTVRTLLLGENCRVKNLVQLNMLQFGISATDRMRFLNAYAQAAGLGRHKSRAIARRVIRKTNRRLKHRARTRMGISQTTVNQWAFQRVRQGRQSGILSLKLFGSDGPGEFLRALDALTESGQVLKDDVATRVVRCTYNGCDIVIKRYNHQGWVHSVRHTIKGSRAQKSWTYGHRLAEAGVAAAAPLGVIEERICGVVKRSWIVNAYVDGPLLYDVMNREGYSPQERQSVLAKSQALLNQMGRHGLVHEDMKPANLIIHDGCPVLIDLDSMQRYRWRWYFRYRFKKMVRYFHTRMHGKKPR